MIGGFIMIETLIIVAILAVIAAMPREKRDKLTSDDSDLLK